MDVVKTMEGRKDGRNSYKKVEGWIKEMDKNSTMILVQVSQCYLHYDYCQQGHAFICLFASG
jgi:hypothetical protein